MTIEFIGAIMPEICTWGPRETDLIESIKKQINVKWPNEKNLFVNLTWFGPQFNNGKWNELQAIINNSKQFDNAFFLSSVDPTMINRDQREGLMKDLQCNNFYWMGNFQTDYEFNFFAIAADELFKKYTIKETLLVEPTHIYLNYNRKPRQHRVDLIKKLQESGLDTVGVNTLGKDPTANNMFSKTKTNLYLSLGEDDKTWEKYTVTQPTTYRNIFGIPDDALSLHRMDIWTQHFLNVSSATEFFPWDPIFVSEIQWKPIIGLRPYVINGNTKTYQWLRDRGFKTFNQYFNGIQLENIPEFEVHDSIISVIKFLNSLDKTELMAMYNDMLPDLIYNKDRFFEFAKEEEYKKDHLFV